MWIPEVDEMETTGWDRLDGHLQGRAVDSAVSSSGWITGVGVGRMADGQIENWEAGWMLHYTRYLCPGSQCDPSRGIHSWERGWRAGRMRDNLQIFSLHLAPGLWFFSLFHHGHCTVHLLPIRTRLLGLECLDMPKRVALSVTYTQHNTSQHSTLIRDTATWKMWLCYGEHQKRKNPEMKDIGSLALEIRKWMRSLCGFRASVDPDNPVNRRSKTRGAQTDLPERGKAC
ncbi:hypothetical protein NEUTE2DRAFT_131257 [Neurospora tetrasperma FGSC 2509]|nr:hypothetical protein NEUTE2DRAFT_131257 [Neurospora tetrasperma FGSC 2509]